jgi:hypothetical protein
MLSLEVGEDYLFRLPFADRVQDRFFVSFNAGL